MGMIVCIDTHVLIWGIKKDSASSQKMMIDRTINFLEWLQNEQQRIIVPAPVLAEFLMRIPFEEHSRISQEIQSKFMVLSFDTACASVYAHIWQKNKNNGLPSDNVGREKMKTDSMIVAIAVTNKAKILYSEDPDIQKFSKGFIETRNIPVIPRQMTLGE